MAIYGKRRYKRKMVQRKKRVYRKGKSTIRSLTAKVNKALKMSKQGLVKHHLYQNIANVDSVVAPYNYYNLTNWNGMQSVFGTAIGDWSSANKLYFNKMSLNVKIEQSLEADNITGSVWVVTLKDQANITSRFNSSTAAIALTANDDYVMLNGRAFLNPRTFNIIRHKRWYFNNGGAALSSTGVGDKRLAVQDLKFNIYPKHYVQNPSNNVRDMVCSYDPSKCYFVIITSDNVLSDFTAPVVSINAHYNVTTAN